MKTIWLVGRKPIIASLILLGVLYTAKRTDESYADKRKEQRFMSGPCGNKFISGNYILGDLLVRNPEEVKYQYYDFGSQVWKIRQVTFPELGKPTTPVVEWELVMERTPSACEQWVKKTGIDFPR